MRPLTEEESKAVFTKLANYIVRPLAIFLPCQCTHLSSLSGQEPCSSHRQAGRAVLLQTSQGSRLLCF